MIVEVTVPVSVPGRKNPQRGASGNWITTVAFTRTTGAVDTVVPLTTIPTQDREVVTGVVAASDTPDGKSNAVVLLSVSRLARMMFSATVAAAAALKVVPPVVQTSLLVVRATKRAASRTPVTAAW